MSGVVVATIIKSISAFLIFALLIASSAAFVAIDEVVSFFSQICLCLIPVLSTIHSSLVSTIDSRSLFVRILVGR